MRRGVWELGEAASDQVRGRERRGLADEFVDLLTLQATPAAVAEQVRTAVDWQSDAAQCVDVGNDLLKQVGADLDFSDAGLRLGVGDTEVRAARRVQAEVADAAPQSSLTRTPDPPSVATIARRPS